MKSAIRIAILLLLPIAAVCQTISVSCRVKDAATNEPVAFANIVESGTQNGIAANEHGQFTLQVSSHSRIVISSTGYKTDTLQLSDKNSLTDILLNASSGNLNEVVISGTMRQISKTESPIPVEVFTAALFRKNPSPTVFESLNMVTGVQPQLNCNVCNTGDIHINGLEGPYTMILIDGMPIVSALSSVYGLHGIPSSIIKRIEVVKGPASTLYGSEAVAGLVNIITTDALLVRDVKADFSATSIGEFNTDLVLKWKTKNAGALLGVNYFNFLIPLDINRDNFTDLTHQNRTSIFNKWNFNRKSGKSASLAFRYVFENRWGGEMQWNMNWRGSDSIYGESIYTHRVELFGTYHFGVKNENLQFDYSYNFHYHDSYYGVVKYLANQHTAFAQLVYDKHFKKVNVLTGMPFRFIYYDDNTPATAGSDTLNNANKPTYHFLPGVFVQADYSPVEKLTMLAGLRYDYHSSHGNIFTPRLSLKYVLHKNHTLRLTGGSGYRVVNLFAEDHAALTGARKVVISAKLKPEQSWNANLNYHIYLSHRFGFIEADFSGFYTYFYNQITGDFASDPQKIIYDNLKGYAVSAGASASLQLSFTNGLHITSGFTYLNVYRMIKNNYGQLVRTPQLYAPAFSGNYTVSYRFQKIGLSADWTGKINGPMYLPVVPNDFRPPQSPWYCIMNIQLTKQLPKHFEIYAGVKNLLNFIPKNPILRPFDPFNKNIQEDNPNGYTFDPSYNYAPVQGVKGFVGVRWSLN